MLKCSEINKQYCVFFGTYSQCNLLYVVKAVPTWWQHYLIGFMHKSHQGWITWRLPPQSKNNKLSTQLPPPTLTLCLIKNISYNASTTPCSLFPECGSWILNKLVTRLKFIHIFINREYSLMTIIVVTNYQLLILCVLSMKKWCVQICYNNNNDSVKFCTGKTSVNMTKQMLFADILSRLT